MRTMVIAEIASCHDGNYNKAAAMIEAAAAAGADYAKAQFWSSADRLAERRKSGQAYQYIYAKYQIPEAWLPLLADQAKAHGIGFMCTTYFQEDISVVAPYVDHFKIASFEAADLDFIQAHYPYLHAGSHRLLIISTGLQDAKMLERLRGERRSSEQIRLLHCVSAYPAGIEHLNLYQIQGERLDGFSDHAAAIWPQSGAVATALGATIIEVHLRLHGTNPENPDAPHALVPKALTEYIRNIRQAQAALGLYMREKNPAEDAMRVYKVQP